MFSCIALLFRSWKWYHVARYHRCFFKSSTCQKLGNARKDQEKTKGNEKHSKFKKTRNSETENMAKSSIFSTRKQIGENPSSPSCRALLEGTRKKSWTHLEREIFAMQILRKLPSNEMPTNSTCFSEAKRDQETRMVQWDTGYLPVSSEKMPPIWLLKKRPKREIEWQQIYEHWW